MTPAPALPLLVFGLTFTYLLPAYGLREAVVRGAVIWGVLVTAGTELTSLVGALSGWTLGAFWLVSAAVAAGLCWTRRASIGEWALTWRPPPRWWVVVIPLGVVMGTVGLVAIVAPPNTWDSMTYHMARVAHWAADRSVSYYPTSIVRQLVESPWSEYAVLQLYVLSGGDRLANLVEWFAMAGSVVTVSLIAARLGASRAGQALAAVFVATLPMGILQASSTQTDYVASFWILCSISLAMDLVDRPGRWTAAWLGAAIGLSLLAKDTAYVFLAPLVVGLAGWGAWRLRSRALFPAVIVVAVVLLLNLGYYVRNQSAFGWPLGPRSYAALYANSKLLAPRMLTSNVIRDLAIQVGTPDPVANAWIQHQIELVHARYLLPVSDPRTTFEAIPFRVPYLSTGEGDAGSPVHLLLMVVAGIAVIVRGIRAREREIAVYGLGLAAAFVVFALYLKWQPWHARLELPVMVAGGALVGAALGSPSRRWVATVVAAALVAASLPWVVDNQTRPLIDWKIPWLLDHQVALMPPGSSILTMSRSDLYFVARPSLARPYEQAARMLRTGSCRDVGVRSGTDDWEYPLWALTGGPDEGFRFDDIDRSLSDAYGADRLPRAAATPCEVVDIVAERHPATLTIEATTYRLTWASGTIGIYAPPARRSRR